MKNKDQEHFELKKLKADIGFIEGIAELILPDDYMDIIVKRIKSDFLVSVVSSIVNKESCKIHIFPSLNDNNLTDGVFIDNRDVDINALSEMSELDIFMACRDNIINALKQKTKSKMSPLDVMRSIVKDLKHQEPTIN